MMNLKSIVKKIGSQAVDPKEQLLILFDESATVELEKFSIIQKRIEGEVTESTLSVGSKVYFDEQEYEIQRVGSVANQHLKAMGHVSVVFSEANPESEMANAIYVTPHQLPQITEGTIITYQ